MHVDIAGRVENLSLPITQPYVPVFECIVNSLESIDESTPKNGRIDVYFHRDDRQGRLIESGDDYLGAVRDVTIVDNGGGFSDINAKAFFVSDSTRKAAKGNKGVGRFTWLKVFEKATIESVYNQSGERYRRSFEFRKSEEGVENETLETCGAVEVKTTVKLINIRSEYQKHFPKSLDTLAQKIIDHLVIYFLSPGCPEMWIHDDEHEPINLNEYFRAEADIRTTEHKFSVGKHELNAVIVRFDSSLNRRHTVSYCANKREVISWGVGTGLPDFKTRFVDEAGKSFVFKTYVFGQYLDSRVDSSRTQLVLSGEDELELDDELSRPQLDTAVTDVVKSAAAPYMTTLREEKRRNIETLVANKAPQYRFMLGERYGQYLDRISPNVSDDQLDIELYKVQKDIELAHREQARQIESLPLEGQRNSELYKHLREQFLREENELGQAALARYVVHRRTILELLDKALETQDDGRYVKEEAVHSIIFPMRASSDDVDFDRQNLWVIDERLAYHWYLGSDLPMNRLKAVNSDESDEPDIVLFNSAKVFAETKRSFNSAVIVEFKRPERNEYPSTEEDPVEQVIRYARKLRDGKAKTDEGRTIDVAESTPFYAYIVCTLTPRIRDIALTRDFMVTPDGTGYFRFHTQLNCYIEILSYDKMLDDAKKRNRAFFDKLQIPML
ncbi:ATP-binding protein [Burkholderia ubonensis]|uniref:ATP-binding protein n=1 Tax=Burkholderia ubonensis TaxID=101571 RepID=UPI000A7F6A2B|nr:ATP-binding protein [Burkholderia ubonensis]